MSSKRWPRIFSVLLMAGMLFGFARPLSISATVPLADNRERAAQVENPLDKVEGLVLEEIQTAGTTDFFIWMVEKADLSPAYSLKTKAEKGQFVFETLRATAERTQQELLGYLESQGVGYESFYIANKVLVYGGSMTLVENLAARLDVAEITANHQYQMQEPYKTAMAPDSSLAIEPNITFINADDVWALGVDGTGIVLAGNDSGIDETHPAIAPHYRGCLNPPTCTSWDHNYNWWDATDTYPMNPDDGYNHGTHVTGIMVGDDGGANQIGVAPGAQTVHCKNTLDNGLAYIAMLTECLQWDLAPWDLNGANPDPAMAPDAVNNSWGWVGGTPQFEDEIAALHAAGIAVEVSAGNEGLQGCSTLRSPGDYEQVLTTGSVNHTSPHPGTISDFSSRGPSSLYPDDYIPDIMAPGNIIRSAWSGGGYMFAWGTSMAGPHVTALIGLIWEANPALQGDVPNTYQLILETAVPLTGQVGSNCGGDYTDGPNNDWGHGTIDALAAVQAALAGTLNGFVDDGTNPIEGALVEALPSSTLTDASGYYSMTLAAGTYDVTASAFGHVTETVTGVTVSAGMTTTLDFTLTPMVSYLVEGYVTDVKTGWPLYAEVNTNSPAGSVWTDPITGYYRITLPEGIAFDFDVSAWVDGYVGEIRVVGPLTANTMEDFALEADLEACNAPGYIGGVLFYEDFESGFGNWTMDGLWNEEAEGDTCGSDVAPFPSSDMAAYYGQDGLCNYLTGGANSGSLTMVNPISITGTNPNIWFSSYEVTECGGNCAWDNRFVEISTDDGATWSELGEGNTEGEWYEKEFDLSPYVGSNALFRFRFDTGDDEANNFFGWMVDNIGIGECSPQPGGLVVGNVYDNITLDGLVGALVQSDEGGMFYTEPTTDDPNLEDGFYTLFTSPGDHDFTASLNPYLDDTQTVSVVDGDTVGQDFFLSFIPTHLQVAHLAPFAMNPGTAVNVTLNGTPALTDFAYGDSTPYLDLFPGMYDVEVYPVGSSTPAITATVDLMSGMHYTAIAIGDGVNQSLSLLALVDNVTPPAAGQFKLRIGHLAPFAAGGAAADVRLDDGTVIQDDVDFSEIAPYLELDAGEYNLKITTPDGATTLIDLAPLTFSDGQILSAFATGDGVNQPLGGYGLPAGEEGFFLPLEAGIYLPIITK